MYSFVVCARPRSYNAKKKSHYEQRILTAFSERYPDHELIETDLYGLVYHFYRNNIDIDADNLSKPIWDTLQNVVFGNDTQVKMRVAGSFSLETNDFAILDLSGLDQDMASILLNAIETEDHVLYVECGTFTVDIVRLNLEKNEY